MAISILGLIFLQVRWLKDSYEKSREQFDKSVGLATKAAFDLERKDMVNALLKKEDPSLLHDRYTCQEGTIEVDRKMTWNGDSSFMSVQIICEEGDSAYLENFEMLLSANKGKRYITTSSHQDSQEIAHQMKEFYALYAQEPINVVKVEDFLKQSLVDNGICLPYRLSIINGPFAGTPKDNQHVFSLGTGSAVLSFDGERAYLLRCLAWHFLSSFMLSALVIACLLYMMSTILRQKKLSEIKNDFISNMTHELKTPISVIAAANEAMRHFQVLDDRERTDKYLKISKNELDRLALMVDKVLDAARLEKQSIRLKPEPVNVQALLETVVDNHKLNSNKDIIFTLKSELKTDSLSLDRMHFSNVLNNIVDNAVKYSKDQVVIDAEIKESPAEVMISIKDEGRGMKSETLKHLFDKFYREPQGDVHDVKGFGLGLHYVKNIMDLIGGQVSVSSQYGQGSRFTLSIPKS